MTEFNNLYAVSAQRFSPSTGLDNFSTPPWVTRALMEKVLGDFPRQDQTCREPACGAGHMSRVLLEYFPSVISSDIHDYGYGLVQDYLELACNPVDWLITNPPFRLAEEFILKGLKETRIGLAVLVRTAFLESVGRYKRLFNPCPPSDVAQFVERVPMVKGRLDSSATTATSYAWLIWVHGKEGTSLRWIPPSRRRLERNGDYNNFKM